MTRKTWITTLAAGAALLSSAATASAATITYEGGTLVYRAGGESNYLTIGTNDEGRITLADTGATATYPAQCTKPEDGWVITCDAPAAIRAHLGDGPDQSNLEEYGFPAGIPVEFHGEGGADTLYTSQSGARTENLVTLDGGAGDDRLNAAEGRDIVRGGPGNDDLRGGGDGDTLEGGDGNDLLRPDVGCDGCGGTRNRGADVVDGGPGVDRLDDWGSAGASIAISIDGQANDGLPGEGDDIRGVEDVYANVSGTYVMSDADDIVYVSSSAEQGANVVRGLGGADRLTGANQSETIDGGAGDDILEGGYNHDTITGGPGRDTIFGDSTAAQCGGYGQSCTVPFGNDTIEARDGEADNIDCGVGTDRAVVDAIDVVANCETVESAGAGPGAGGGTTDGSSGPAPAAKRCKVPRIKAGSTATAARKKLKKAGCAYRTRKVESRRVRKGRVVKTSPKAGRTSSRVTLYLAR